MNVHFMHFSNIVIDTVIFSLHMCTILDIICYKCIIFAWAPRSWLTGAEKCGWSYTK